MDDRFGAFTNDIVHFLTEQDGLLNISLGELHVLTRGSVEAADVVPICSSVNSDTSAAAFTSPNVILPTGLRSVVNLSVGSALVFSSPALPFKIIKSAVTGVAEGSSAIAARSCNRVAFAKVSMDSVLDFHP